MSKFSNIYDIDGNLIRGADEGPFTLEETEKLVDDLTKKVQDNPDNEVYKVYLNNAQKWLMKLYNEMSREDLMKRISITTNKLDEAKKEASEAEQKQLDEITKAMENLKKEYEDVLEGAKIPDDMMEEIHKGIREDNHVVMDEYVEPIEEINEEDREDIHTLHSEQSEDNEVAVTE